MMNNLRIAGGALGRGLARALLGGLLAWGAAACQQGQPEAARTQAGASRPFYTCPMHPQIVRDQPGDCPICGMTLVKAARQVAPVRPAAGAAPPAVAAHYTCPMHPQINREKPGDCPICGMTLVKVANQPANTRSPKPNAPPAAEVTLSAQQIQLANIHVAPFGSAPAAGRPVLTGTLTADANQTSSVSSRVSGRVERLFVRQTGETIRQGAPLVSLYSEELQALQQDYLLSLAQQRLGGPDVSQYVRLAEGARQRLRLLGLSAGQLRALAATGRPTPSLTFYSPQAGLVQTVGVTEGQYVSEGTPLVSLTNLASLWVEAQLYPEEVAGIRLGQSVRVQVAGFAASYPGKVIFLSPELEANSRVALLRVQLANPAGRLQPGMQANVRLPAPGASAHTLALPQAAVLHDSRGSYVWQQVAAGRFRRLRVTTGTENDQTVAITGGLAAGAPVVVSGGYLLESEYALYQSPDPMAGMSAATAGPAGQAPAMSPNNKM